MQITCGSLGVVERISNIFKRTGSFHDPATSVSEWADGLDNGSLLMDDIDINHSTAMGIAAVFSCVKVISEDLAVMDVQVQKRDKNGYWSTTTDHYLNDFFNNPAPSTSWYSICETTTANAALSGNGFLRIYRDKFGRPIQSDVRQFADVSILRNHAKTEIIYHVNYGTGQQEYLYPWEIVHLRAFSMNGISGISPILAQKGTISISLQANQYANETYKTGGYGGGIITHPLDLSAAARERISKGVKNQQALRMFPVLDEGMKFTPNRMSPADIDYINTMKFSRAEINSLYRVALHLTMQNEQSTAAGTEDDSLNHINRCLLPWARRWENELEQKFLSKEERRNTRIVFNTDTVGRGNMNQRMEYLKGMALMQLMTRNELRAQLNLPPVDGGDEFVDFQKAKTPKPAENLGQIKSDDKE